MTRSTPLEKAVAAKRKAMAAAIALAEPASMEFRVFEDNRGGYQWTIVGPSGQSLAQSASFTSSEEAKQAARLVHAGAGSASLEHLEGATSPVDLVGRRNTRVVRDDLDAERWLDETGSSSSEKVTGWPAGR
jgi:uncharacterized protein YegP (UPF0339 family)